MGRCHQTKVHRGTGNDSWCIGSKIRYSLIKYIGVKTGEDIKLNIKLYTPLGLSTGSSSPSGFSYTASVYVYSGDNTEVLGGWGNSSRGYWSRGNYRFEIWYADVCLKSKKFTIY